MYGALLPEVGTPSAAQSHVNPARVHCFGRILQPDMLRRPRATPKLPGVFCVDMFDAERSAGSRHLCPRHRDVDAKGPAAVAQTKPLQF